MALVSMREIKRKIRSIKNIQLTTRAMMLVSAAKFKKLEPQLKNYRIYMDNFKRTIEEVISKEVDYEHPFLQVNTEINLVGVLILTSQRGLCGAFNSNLCKYALSNIPPHSELIIIGKKGYDFFKYKPYSIKKVYSMPDKLTPGFLKNIIDEIIEGFLSKKYSKVICFYNKHKSAISYLSFQETLLPIQLNKKRRFAVEYLCEPTKKEVLDVLLKTYINLLVEGILLESQVSEHSARMLAMEQATNNAAKLIDKLWLDFNKARQAAVTKEIADIINSSEVMRKRR